MATNAIADAINALSEEQQASVLQFIEFLKSKGAQPPVSFLAAADEFIAVHPEILRRLAL